MKDKNGVWTEDDVMAELERASYSWRDPAGDSKVCMDMFVDTLSLSFVITLTNNGAPVLLWMFGIPSDGVPIQV